MPSSTYPMNGSRDTVVKADLTGLDAGRDFVTTALSELEAGPEAVFALTTSFLELFENLIRHGYAGRNGEARISVVVRGDMAELVVSDDSGPFDQHAPPGRAYEVKGIHGKDHERRVVCRGLFPYRVA